MVIKIIKNLEDAKGMEEKEIVEVHTGIELGGRMVMLRERGCVYNIGTDRFSLIEPIISNTLPPIGRVCYNWDTSYKMFVSAAQSDLPFERDSREYTMYEGLLEHLEEA